MPFNSSPVESLISQHKDEICATLKEIHVEYKKLGTIIGKLGKLLKDDLKLSREQALKSNKLFWEFYITIFLETYPVRIAFMTSSNIDDFRRKWWVNSDDALILSILKLVLSVFLSRANDDWPIDDRVMENKIAELKAKEMQQLGEGTARKYQAKINYQDETGLMVMFLKGIDDLRDKHSYQESVLLEGELNESNTEACREKIKGIETEISELKRRFYNCKNYAITAMKSKFERSIIYDIYGAPEKVPKQREQKDAADHGNIRHS